MRCFVRDACAFNRGLTSQDFGYIREEKQFQTGKSVRIMERQFNESSTDFVDCVTMEGSSLFSTNQRQVFNISTTSHNNVTSNWTSLAPPDVIFGNLYLHPHWIRYLDVIESAPGWFLNFVGVYMTVICIIGVIGNLTVITVFLK
jgi:hypothetical protein